MELLMSAFFENDKGSCTITLEKGEKYVYKRKYIGNRMSRDKVASGTLKDMSKWFNNDFKRYSKEYKLVKLRTTFVQIYESRLEVRVPKDYRKYNPIKWTDCPFIKKVVVEDIDGFEEWNFPYSTYEELQGIKTFLRKIL